MRKLSIVCLWAFIIFLLLGVLIGIVTTILQFVEGNIAAGFSDLLWTCVMGATFSATVGVKVYDKEREG